MRKCVGIIGFGNMGSSIAKNLAAQFDKYELWVFDKDKNKIEKIPGIKIAENNSELADNVETVLLAVKPLELNSVFIEIKEHVQSKLIISIAAGITMEYIEKKLGDVRIIRAMPNMPAKVGEGITCLCRNKSATDSDFLLAQRLFYVLGKTLRIEEKMVNAATAISGSGPGFFFDFIESKKVDFHKIPQELKYDFQRSLEKAARAIGFNLSEAVFLAAMTVNGSIALLEKTNFSPCELIKKIASKGGTTEAGLDVLHKGATLEEAVKAALNRAEQLSRIGG